MKLSFLSILLIFTTIVFSQTPRGRVQIQNGTIVSDMGTLLRGARISTDGTTTFLPSRDDVSNIKNLGLNSIHLYAECPEYQTPGDCVLLVDSIVKWTENDSLYLIITIGGCNQNCQFDSAFVRDFWDYYAPRYADKTHVIYEIVNEPFESFSGPYDSVTIEMEKWAYQIIRTHAPATHILLMTYDRVISIPNVIQDLSQLEGFIDWSNASVAIHGYGTSSEEGRINIRALKDSGYTLTVTEPQSIENYYVNLAATRVFEQEFVSYTHFIPVYNLIHDPSAYRTRIENSELRWDPDFGTWPMSDTTINYADPYQVIKARFYDEGYGFQILTEGEALGFISNYDYAAFYYLDFEDGPASFEAECSSGENGGDIELHLDSTNGPLVGTCHVTPTGNWNVYETYSCATGQFDEIHNLYLVFRGNICCDLLNLDKFVFHKTSPTFNKQLASSYIQEVQVYPNPAKSFINVSIDENATIEIYNIQGQLMISGRLSVKNNMIPVNNLSSGSYVVKIINNTKVFSEVLIIE